MTSEIVKKLTGKNNKDFEFAAAHIVNQADVDAFKALVEQSDFLFDFIKRNVEKRLSTAVNANNYKNLLSFLKVYSYDYEDFIISNLVKYADEEMTDEMLERLENGTDDEKAYSAKYFSYINDTLSIEPLRKYSYSDFDALATNCAEALSKMKDEPSYLFALEKLKSEDEFEKLSAVRFLTAYQDYRAIDYLFKTMKKSSMPENIASEISYLQSFLHFLDTDFKYDTLLALNHIINGLGEIVSLSQIFDFQLYDVLEKAIDEAKKVSDSKIALVLLNAKLKFEQLTENEEYIFDESKDTKEEVYAIRDFLNSQSPDFWQKQKQLFLDELIQESDFVMHALDLVQELGLSEALDKLKGLLNSDNQTIVLKTVEVIKSLNKMGEISQEEVLTRVSDENIRLIIQSLFR